MYIIYIGLVLAAAFFAIQLILCLKVRPLAVRMIPIYLIASGFALCAFIAIFGKDSSGGFIVIYAWQVALVLAIIPAIALIGDGLAWGVSAAVKRKSK